MDQRTPILPKRPIMKAWPFCYRFLLILLPAVTAAGCFQARQTYPSDPFGITVPGVVYHENPASIPPGHPEQVWEIVVDVVDDYFKIEREEPLRQVENFILEGQLNTFPCVGATLLEPWRHDSANLSERIEATVQSIQRTAVVRVIPDESGYQVEVAVYKYLEDVKKPEHSTSGEATFRYDDSLNRVVNPVVGIPVRVGWVSIGRDMALEQRIIGQILSRTGTVCTPCSPANTSTGIPACGPAFGQIPADIMTTPATPIPTPAPENRSFVPGAGNTWTRGASPTDSTPAHDWQPVPH